MKPVLLFLVALAALAALSSSTLFSQPFRNRSIGFDGSVSRLQTLNGTTGYNPPQITVEAWIYPTRVSGTNIIAEDAASGNSSQGWLLYISDSKLVFRASDDVCCAQNCISAASVPLNTWSHVAGTYTGDDFLRDYING